MSEKITFADYQSAIKSLRSKVDHGVGATGTPTL
jgi:hypothetical protein